MLGMRTTEPDRSGRPDRAELVVVVDEDDLAVGVAGKLDAHQGAGLLHRAVSACLYDTAGRLVLQQRSRAKYHFPARWSNACCTHPRPGESPLDAIARRVREELGVSPAALEPVGSFTYRAEDPTTGLVEHELDHVVVGVLEDDPRPDPGEVMAWRAVEADEVRRTDWRGDAYTPWLDDVLRVAARAGR